MHATSQRRGALLASAALLLLASCGLDALDVGSLPAGDPCDPATTDVLCPVVDPNPDDEAQPRRFNPTTVLVEPGGAVAWVALTGSEAEPGAEVVAIDVARGVVAARVAVGDRPVNLAMHPGGRWLLVTSWYAGFITVVDVRTRTAVARLSVPFYADDLAFDASGSHLYLVNRWSDGLYEVPVEATDAGVALGARETWRFVATGSNPSQLSLCPDGRYAFVTATGDLAVTRVDLTGWQAERLVLNAPVNDVLCLGRSAVATTLGAGSGHPQEGSAPCEELRAEFGAEARCDGTANVRFADIQNELAVIDVATLAPGTRYTSDTAERSAVDAKGHIESSRMVVAGAFPARMALDGSTLYVTMAGSGQVQRFELAGAASDWTGALAGTSTLDGVGFGPEGVGVASGGSTLVVANQLSEDVALIDLASGQVRSVVVGNASPPFPATGAELGELYFRTAYFSADGDGSCMHCHPGLSTDGKAWSVATVRLGASRQVPQTRNLRATRPLFLEGTQTEEGFNLEMEDLSPRVDYDPSPAADYEAGRARRDAEFRRISAELIGREVGFDEMVKNVGRFLIVEPRLLPNPNSPNTEAAQRGQVIFTSASVGCAACHVPETAFTTGRLFVDVIANTAIDRPNTSIPASIAGTFGEVQPEHFDTPSLRGLWDRPSRFLHDGRARTIAETILPPEHPALGPQEVGCNFGGSFVEGAQILDSHGGCSQLGPEDVADLLAFLRAIE